MDDDKNRFAMTLRLPADLHTRLARYAADRSRSMNAEIIERLESSFRDSQTPRQITPQFHLFYLTMQLHAVSAQVSLARERLETLDGSRKADPVAKTLASNDVARLELERVGYEAQLDKLSPGWREKKEPWTF